MSVARCIDDLARAVNDKFTEAHLQRLAATRYVRANGKRVPKLEEMERNLILQAVAACNGNHVRAAELVGIGKTTLYRKLREYQTNEKSTR